MKVLCRNYSGTLDKDDEEVMELQFYELDNIPTDISSPDLPIINKYLQR